ncbi:hypothetical protein DL769_009415 [Monosporascus sp. CRB-8-3]|nr:hypothetical protein DL769_009415 [Monosporascus sp. CRB-8-3]
MAEPLSTIASVVALCQATTAILKGYQVVANLPKASPEFRDLLNELTASYAYLTAVHRQLADTTAPISPYPNPELSYVLMVTGEFEARIREPKMIAEKVASEAKGPDNNGHLRIKKLKWHFTQDQIRQQRDAILRAILAVGEGLQLLRSSQSMEETIMHFSDMSPDAKNICKTPMLLSILDSGLRSLCILYKRTQDKFGPAN